MRGEVVDWEPATDTRTMVSVRVTECLPAGLGMDAFGDTGAAARQDFHRKITSFRHCRIWGMSPAQQQAIREVFGEQEP
jgi:hypothetical protein